ncbi:MAG: tandem-95 repeat protein [Moorea sp. SIO1G6]|uniref:Ig-like domain-containing protein n=1 Tax=Moorena sp. SIO1G6 TaxID=2607840 RepID=UPI0013C0B9DA|nr:Ig-like domain-containing protein [Moorena sp. SIO1G6]NET63811.1 tandem-95 repeat protein [Moorena sp. SIO1G6]
MPRFEFDDPRFTLNTFQVSDNNAASNNKLIDLPDGNSTGTATTTFDLPSGTYQVILKVADETDGNSTVGVTIGNQTFSFTLDDPNPNAGIFPDADAFKDLTVSNSIFIPEGTQITISGESDDDERIRLDYIDFNLLNEAPVPVDDTATTDQSTEVIIDVLGNDSDPEGDPLTVNIEAQQFNGTAVVNQDNTITYTPNDGFTGTDTFTYQVSDGINPGVTATVTVDVPNKPPVAEDDTASTDLNTAVTIDVLANDVDPEGDPLTVTLDQQGGNGTAVVNDVDGTITYTPVDGFTGTDTFTYQLSDGINPPVKATVSVNVNQPPVADNDTATTTSNTAVNINVLGNDTDADGDGLTVTIEPQEFNGTAVVNDVDGTITYTPNADFTGADSFTYQVSDGTNPPVTATVNVEVTNPNQPPAPVDDTATTTSNTAVTIDVLGNDTDADGDGLTVTIEQQEFNGTAVVNQDGTITYTPNNGFTGTDTFTYQVSDGVNDPVTATVNVNVTNNQSPVATNNNNTATTEPNTQVTIDVLANYSDPDGDPLSFAIVTEPTNGTAAVNDNGTPDNPTDDFIIYTPNADFTGTDSLTFEVSDGSGGTSTGTVNITIEESGPVSSTLTQNANNTFTITGDTAGQSQLQFTLTGREAGEVSEIGVFAVDSAEGTINGIAPGQSGYVQAALSQAKTIFSVLPDGLGTAQATRTIDSFDVNDNLVFYVIQGGSKDGVLGGQDPTSNVFFSGASFNSDGQNHVQVTDNGNGQLTLGFEDGNDGDFNDATVIVSDGSGSTPPVGTGTTQIQGQRELLDLTDVTGTVTGSLVVNSEASFNNTIGWYRIDDESGTVNGINVGNAGYAQAALSNQVDLSAGVSGGVLLAPFLISDGTVAEFLADNPSNADQEDSDLNAFFAFVGANPDGVDHVRLLGDNTFGFEDLFGGGDQDYNDVVVQVNLSVA